MNNKVSKVLRKRNNCFFTSKLSQVFPLWLLLAHAPSSGAIVHGQLPAEPYREGKLSEASIRRTLACYLEKGARPGSAAACPCNSRRLIYLSRRSLHPFLCQEGFMDSVRCCNAKNNLMINTLQKPFSHPFLLPSLGIQDKYMLQILVEKKNRHSLIFPTADLSIWYRGNKQVPW